MNRKIKDLSLALIAALVLTAMVASPASAGFTSSSTHTILSGSQEGSHVFTAGEGFGAISCSTASFSGTTASTNEAAIELLSSYSGCKDSFGRTVDWHCVPNGCWYKPTTNGWTHRIGWMYTTVTSGGSVICTVEIKAPQENNGTSYDNLGGTSGIRITTNSTNVRSITSGGFFNCGISNGEHTEGTYTGSTVITGKDTSGNAVAISRD